MVKKLTSYFLIFALLMPSFLMMKPRDALAYYPIPIALARAALTQGQRVGIAKVAADAIEVLYKPFKGKLIKARFKKWSGPVTAAFLTEAAILALLGYNDKPAETCTNVLIQPTWAGTPEQTFASSTPASAVAAYNTWWNNQQNPNSTCGLWTANYQLGAQNANNPNYYNLGGQANFAFASGSTCNVTPTSHGGGSVSCQQPVTNTKSAYDDYVDVNFADPNKTTAEQDAETQRLADAAREEYARLQNEPTDGSTGVEVVGVDTATYTDANGVEHTYTINPDGSISHDGVLIPDQADVVDINGNEHNYTIDPLTGEILDDGVPTGNMATWVDAEGNAHRVTVDPVTGQLLVDGEPWNPNFPIGGGGSTPPDGSGSGGATVVTDPTTGSTTVNVNIDLSPVVNMQARQLTEMKKATDAINATKDNVKAVDDTLKEIKTQDTATSDMLYTQTQDIKTQLEASHDMMYAQTSTIIDAIDGIGGTSIDTYGADTRPMTMDGLTSQAQRIVDNSPLGQIANSLYITTFATASLPIFTLDLLSFGAHQLDLNDYSAEFDTLGVFILIIASGVAVRVVFRTE